jgi:MarR-like DNA-binding transcriptional regulator SgrR of sgrS sRNA
MKRICLLLAAALSAAGSSQAATRPHFGGTLRIEAQGSVTSLDPKSNANAEDSFLQDLLLTSVCDRLVTLDADGNPRTSLAMSWRSERDGRSWYFTLRAGVAMHNGGVLSQQTVIAALSSANPGWRVRAEEHEVLIQSDTPLTNLVFELAEPRNSICLLNADGQLVGSGPFQIAAFQSGHLDLNAFEDSWQGRPFLDHIHVEMNKSLADQTVDLLGRADMIRGDVAQRPSNSLVQTTQPIELIALAFALNRAAVSDPRLRQALALALDRESIFSVLLRRQGEASASLLPEWVSGYAHLFTASQDLLNARRLVSHLNGLSPLSIGYEANDPLARLIAERVAVNAREAGIGLQPVSQTNGRTSTADIAVVRIKIESPNPAAALMTLGGALRLPALQKAQAENSAEALYTLESDALKDYAVIPIAHIPEAFTAVGVHDWQVNRWGAVNWGDLWMEAPK